MTHSLLHALPLLLVASILHAQPASAPATEPASAPSGPASSPSVGLGARYESQTAGIAFRPPADMEPLKQSATVERVVTYVNEKQKMVFSVTRLVLAQPLPLLTPEVNKPGLRRPDPGLLDMQETQLAAPPLSAKILRKDVINAGRNGTLEVGMVAARYAAGPQRFLRQQALVRYSLGRPEPNPIGHRPGLVYFHVEYTTPSGKTADDDLIDPAERAAVETFNLVLDTIEVFDLRPLAKDAEERLFRTRTLLLNSTRRRIESTIVPEQIYLIMREGEPLGYSYIAEEIDLRDGQEGLVVALRTRTFPAKAAAEDKAKGPPQPEMIDTTAEMFATFDRRYETWASRSDMHFGKDRPKDQVREVGSLAYEAKRVFQNELDDKKNPRFHIEERFALSVTRFGAGANEPAVDRDVPPYYLPQAWAHLLPRLLPLREVKTYMFAVWVSNEREVIRRYVDVEAERRVNLGGNAMLAVPVKDRIGLEGSPTYHYFSVEGRYLGSVNNDTRLAVLASNADAVRRHWKDAVLSTPRMLNPTKRGK